MQRRASPEHPPPSGPVDPIFDLRAVRASRPPSSAWITVHDSDLIADDDSGATPVPRARRIVVRIVGYLLIGALFWSMAELVARRPFRDAILDWTTFGLSEHVRSAEKWVADFVRRRLSH